MSSREKSTGCIHAVRNPIINRYAPRCESGGLICRRISDTILPDFANGCGRQSKKEKDA